MTLNAPLCAIVDDAGRVLGDGECPALHTTEPTAEQVEFVRLWNDNPFVRVVRCVLVPCPESEVPRG